MFDIAKFFELIGDGGAAFGTALGQIATSVAAIFWVPGTEGQLGSPTFIGGLTIAGLVGSLSIFALNWITKLFKGTTRR